MKGVSPILTLLFSKGTSQLIKELKPQCLKKGNVKSCRSAACLAHREESGKEEKQDATALILMPLSVSYLRSPSCPHLHLSKSAALQFCPALPFIAPFPPHTHFSLMILTSVRIMVTRHNISEHHDLQRDGVSPKG